MTKHNQPFPLVYLARHGETEWSLARRHTGLTDMALTERGERHARELGARIEQLTFSEVWTSPLQRAARTCELAGQGTRAIVCSDLVEWDYGEFEGLTTKQIRAQQPHWELFRDGCPNGESIVDLTRRIDRVIDKLRLTNGTIMLFAHGHFLSVFAARWLGLDGSCGRYFFLDTAAFSALGYHHGFDDPVIKLWNDCRHLQADA